MTICCVDGEEEQGASKAIIQARERYEDSRLALETAIRREAAQALALLAEHGFKASLEPDLWKLEGMAPVRIRLEF